MIKCNPREMNPFCSRLSEEARASMCPHCSIVQVRKGEYLPSSEDAHAIGIVRSGAIAVDVPTETGNAFSTFVACPGDILNLIKLVDKTMHHDASFNNSHRAFAVVDSTIGLVPLETMGCLLDHDPLVSRLLFECAVDRVRVIIESFEHSKTLDSTERIRRLIATLDLAGIDISDITHDTIGRILGMNRVTVTRAMAKIIKGTSPSA